MMKNLQGLTKLFFSLASGAILFSSCATIIGGSNYYAHVTVADHPNAAITYKGEVRGQGYAAFKVPRREANIFSVIVKEQGCDEQDFDFKERTFRGWALFGTIITWTGVIDGIPLPWGVVVDAASGAFWKPDINEKGVTKTDYKHYNYHIDYTGCKTDQNKDSKAVIKTKVERLSELKDLVTKGLITQEEYDNEKKKIIVE